MSLKTIRNWGIALVLAFVIISTILYLGIRETEEKTHIDGENPVPTAPIHWHPELTIIIDNVEQSIPTNIGLETVAHAPVHTHETNGTIHLENHYPSRRDMRLGYFFELWNKEFSNECIFDYCTDKGTLRMRVNSVENTLFDDYIMADGDIIVIEYASFKM